ncbi:expressed unknown protein [Seminavis robusta]|uniref:Fungal lipase-type domain-containing protein n=1 Tax=Seminavis robusta TaxID=568900 RepID=A0A9N8EXU2_9STRA|nr:expressed unknown protein [Seminavis robusta]|eukprot:Sro2320_g323170.1 n/a (451) ;mRNA; f:10495-11847
MVNYSCRRPAFFLGILGALVWNSLPTFAVEPSASLRGGNEGEDNARSLQDRPALQTTWTQDFAKRGQRSCNLTHLVKSDTLMDEVEYYDTEVYQRFMAWDDGVNDRTLVVKDENVCYLVFQGMNRHVFWDYIQTLSPFVKHNVFGSDCDVRRSFYRAYETNFADEMREYLDDCVQSCIPDTEAPCPVVLAGHSTGAATATIASLDPRMRKYDPVTYALGPLRAIINECNDIDGTKIYRIVAANAGVYDAASDGSPKKGRHYGESFIMDEMNQFIYLGLNDAKLRYPDNYNIHIIETYLNRMNALGNQPAENFPMTVAQFDDGHWCTEDDECNSGHCNLEAKVCGPATMDEDGTMEVGLLPGSECTENESCVYGLCVLGRCAMENGKLGSGSACEEHDQCDSEKCFNSFCQDKLYNGSWCKEDYECISNSCSGPMSWIQMRKCADPPTEAP